MDEARDASPVTLGAVVPHFRVHDVARTAAYYRDVLGFEVAGFWDGQETHHDPRRTAVFGILQRDQTTIHLNRAAPDDLMPMPADGAYDIYVHVTGIDDLADEFRGRGAELIDGPANRPYGQRELILRDCDGRVLAFGEAVGAATAHVERRDAH